MDIYLLTLALSFSFLSFRIAMNRRAFLMTIAATLIPKVIRVSTPLLLNYQPTPAQVKFFNQRDNVVSLYGIPYHQSNAGIGQWLGIP